MTSVGGGSPSPRLSARGLLAAAGLVAAVTLVARAVGLARWMVFSHSVGSTCVGHVYAAANQVPNVMFEIAAGGALAAVAVPLVARHLEVGREDLADRTASALLGWVLLVLLPLTVLVALAAAVLAPLLVGGVQGCDPAESAAAARLMLLLMAPQVVLYGIGIVLAGVLQAHRRFLAAAVAPLLSSVVVVGVYLAFGARHDPTVPLGELPRSALVLLAGGTTLGVVALSLPLLLPAVRLGVRWRPTLRFPKGSGPVAGALALAGLVGVGAQQLSVLVVLALTGRAEVGGIQVWNYAQTVYLLPYAVLVVPLATAAFPRLTGPRESALPTLRRSTTAAVVAAVAGAAALVAARREVGEVFLRLDAGAGGAGRVTLEALPSTLAALAPGLIGFSLLAVLSRALYAVRRPGRAASGVVVGWLVAAVVPLLMVPRTDGTVGAVLLALAVGSSVGMSLGALVLVRQTVHVWGVAALTGVLRAAAVATLGAVLAVVLREVALPTRFGGAAEAIGWALLGGALVLVAVTLALRLGAPGAVADLDPRASRAPQRQPGPARQDR